LGSCVKRLYDIVPHRFSGPEGAVLTQIARGCVKTDELIVG
jgi:hypothetical protein